MTYYCTKKDSKNLIGRPHKKGGYYFHPQVSSAIIISQKDGKTFIQKNEAGQWPEGKNWSDFITGMDITYGRIIIEES